MDYLITVDIDLVTHHKMELSEGQVNEQLLRTFQDEGEIHKEARALMEAMAKTKHRTKLDMLAEKYGDCKRWIVTMGSVRDELAAVKREKFGSGTVETHSVVNEKEE